MCNTLLHEGNLNCRSVRRPGYLEHNVFPASCEPVDSKANLDILPRTLLFVLCLKGTHNHKCVCLHECKSLMHTYIVCHNVTQPMMEKLDLFRFEMKPGRYQASFSIFLCQGNAVFSLTIL